MPKRLGRPLKPDGERRSCYINVRARPDMRKRLESEAARNDCSLTSEITRRIELSFVMEDVEAYLLSRFSK